jgi:hypothetical protein
MKIVLYANFVDSYRVTSLQTVKICLLFYLTYTTLIGVKSATPVGTKEKLQ